MAIELGELTCAGTARRVAAGDLSAAELIEATLDAITAQEYRRQLPELVIESEEFFMRSTVSLDSDSSV